MFSQVKKNESALEKIKGYQGVIQIYPGKMEFCQIKRERERERERETKKKKKKKKKTLLG